MGDTCLRFLVSMASSAGSTSTTGQDRPVASHEQAEATGAAGFGIAHIEHTEHDLSEVDLPPVVVDLFETDQLSGEAVRQIPLRVAKGNHAVWIRALHAKMRRILGLRELAWIRA